jgi:excisionase family DNA binding protein
MDNLLNVRQVAFILKVHPLTIRRYIKESRLKAIMVGGNVRIKESDLISFNKEVSPKLAEKKIVKNKIVPAKRFTLADPIFRLKGRGASVNLSG